MSMSHQNTLATTTLPSDSAWDVYELDEMDRLGEYVTDGAGEYV
jgi:hypothetical protein